MDMPHSNFTFDTMALPFSAPQTLTLLPLTLYIFTPPLLLPIACLSTVQFVPRLAQRLFQSSALTATEMPVAPNCHTFRVLYKYYKNCFLSPLFRSSQQEYSSFTVPVIHSAMQCFRTQDGKAGEHWRKITLLVTVNTWIYTHNTEVEGKVE